MYMFKRCLAPEAVHRTQVPVTISNLSTHIATSGTAPWQEDPHWDVACVKLSERKKCDEAKPECRRCTTSGVTCVYEYVEVPREQSYKVRRTKPAPRTIPERLATAPRDVFRNVLFSPDSLEPSSSRPPDSSPVSGSSAVVSRSSLREPWAEQPDLAHSIHPLDRTSSQTFPLALSRIPYQIDQIDVRSPSVNHRGQDLRIPGTYNVIPFNPVVVPTGSLRTVDHDEVDEADEDPEGIQALIYTAPTLDKNVTDNSLITSIDSQWTVASIFEPLEIVHGIREHAIQRFSSQDTRYKTILMANVMKGFAQDPLIDNKRMSILSYLAVEVQKIGCSYLTKPQPTSEQDRQNAMYILDYALEVRVSHIRWGIRQQAMRCRCRNFSQGFLLRVFTADASTQTDIATNYLEIKVLTLQTRTQSTFAVMKSMNCIAPIFRRACPDLPGRPINLPNIILGDRIGLRYFACSDILVSVLSGTPTYFQYEVPFSLDLCNRVKSYQSFQSIQGVPDQLIMFFAWVNSLCETPGAGDNPEVVAWAEEILPQIKFVGGETGDPVLRICRMAIQECWRLAAYIYLYMALCRVDAHDPRVVRAQQNMLRVIKRIKQGRLPDPFLGPMIVAAVATTNENERKMISRRFFAVREGSKPGTLYHESTKQLMDIWHRTREEGRPAVWPDLRIGLRRVTAFEMDTRYLLSFEFHQFILTSMYAISVLLFQGPIYARMQYMQDEVGPEYGDRRKKCDETKPQCRRCTSAGKICSYEYVERPESESYRIKRTKPAPRPSDHLDPLPSC
ncbi:fungal zn(2)-Cys(6) binuclear cluster domain-containing protein [Rhizoctonia solani AG-1 IA]|uniref:Fungal zn(2)-Cys(6) binuclear cluster domain-containing protein n=1 Tax=Thanatephorus cucumeris (strain AG1-IA) TaxID=983506 RepID=L8WIL3_THACA|nr:fungal zn(2)-Cys(6) binuclear cluster domain-containing protein [Rhizoctonia solani AG-1 IA]